jgi:GGDEF domain-containing protein
MRSRTADAAGDDRAIARAVQGARRAVVLYLNFVRYTKIEEIYGWEKLDAVLETTAAAVREFLDDTRMSTSR